MQRDKIEFYLDGKRIEQLDVDNPSRTCKSMQLSGVQLPHVWAQLQDEGGTTKWQIFTAGGWVDMPDHVDVVLKQAQDDRKAEVQYNIGKHAYKADLVKFVQINAKFGSERPIREPTRRDLENNGVGEDIIGGEMVWQVQLSESKWV